ncbi:MAG TPA: CpsB/CapC family capsule biosynthesis tyrosine phosphatase [Kofleriaceae bacterium]|nr:CpsB/CapC family capsule biosynthesis tyrosine phosphatase [Kofleriaceae bacterium]
MGFLDLHSHVLPGLDDGARDLATARAMLGGLAALGFTDVYATPHQKAGQFMPTRAAIDQAFAGVQAALAAAGAGAPTLRLAAENMWDDVFFERTQHGTVPAYDDGDAFLVELRPQLLPVGLVDHLFRLRMAGKAPILAHPERYEALWDDRDLVERLRANCAFVVDLGALAGYHGKRQQKMARHLVEDGIAAAVTSDAHTLEDVRVAAEGIAWVQKRLGAAAVSRLLDDGPRAALAGELPE